jgi:uncharacterized membrane protein (GlpM family)
MPMLPRSLTRTRSRTSTLHASSPAPSHASKAAPHTACTFAGSWSPFYVSSRSCSPRGFVAAAAPTARSRVSHALSPRRTVCQHVRTSVGALTVAPLLVRCRARRVYLAFATPRFPTVVARQLIAAGPGLRAISPCVNSSKLYMITAYNNNYLVLARVHVRASVCMMVASHAAGAISLRAP